ncbi:hypothetical protein BgiBS90_006622 [Biomphalaria glabrata]|nr:hypothetical protein BgiBS90_006622 [Biomphalaria glabrata]
MLKAITTLSISISISVSISISITNPTSQRPKIFKKTTGETDMCLNWPRLKRWWSNVSVETKQQAEQTITEPVFVTSTIVLLL